MRCLSELAEFCAGGVGKQGKDKDTRALGELTRFSRARIADDCPRLIEPSHPAGASGIANDEHIGLNSRGDQHCPCNLEEFRPLRDDADQLVLQLSATMDQAMHWPNESEA